MSVINKDVIIVGGGPAGLAAAVALHKQGITDLLVIEREKDLGGILRQCIHDGFGLTRFRQTLSGPEYAQRFIDEAEELGIQCVTDTTVLNVSTDKLVTTISSREGMGFFQARAVILAMGCRERTRGALAIPGDRPSGVFTAGVAQAYINLHNTMVGKEVVILGSGDIGMIMARRLTLEGAHVKGVYELLPYPSGLPRNVMQCLEDYNIPLHLSKTVTKIHGRSRLVGVTVSEMDENRRPVPGSEERIPCDTLVLSVGLIPENELSLDAGVALDGHTKGAVVDEHYQTNVPGIFAAGNVLHVHDLVDFVSLEAERLAHGAAQYLKHGALAPCAIPVKAGNGVNHTIPQAVSGEQDVLISLRVRQPFKNCSIVISQSGKELHRQSMHKAIPAEMIQLTLKKDLLSGREPVEVSVSEAALA